MSFRAVISDHDRHNLWYKVVHLLSTIHEELKFTLTSNEIILWSINGTDTSLCQATFPRSFFDEFIFKPYEIVFGESGIQVIADAEGRTQKLYTFRMNARQCTTISRPSDNDTVKKFTMEINNTGTCPEPYTNRLLVAVELGSLITKEYSPQIDPIQFDPIIINLKYKRKFLDVFGTNGDAAGELDLDPNLIEVFNKTESDLSSALFNEDMRNDRRQHNELTAEDEINYFSCNIGLLKNFLDNCNANVTDEIKLEINTHKLVVTAFTKALYGSNNDLLRNTLSMSNTISTSDLDHYCLFNTTSEKSLNNEKAPGGKREAIKSIVFKLRDFKNFMNLGLFVKAGNTFFNENTNVSREPKDSVKVWFCQAGDPILMEIERRGLRLELVQVTDSTRLNVQVTDLPSKNSKHTSKYHASNNKATKLSPKAQNKYKDREFSDIHMKNARTSPLKNKEPCSPVQTDSGSNKRTVLRNLFVTESQEPATQDNKDQTQVAAEQQNTDTEMSVSQELFKTTTTSIAERTNTTVLWGNQKRKEHIPDNEQCTKKAHHQDGNRGYLTQQNNDINNEENMGLGPTQKNRPKGLFDP